MPLQIIRQNIAAVACDAVVNPTNRDMIPTGGADAAIHAAAGNRLAKACAKLAPLGVGEAILTPAFGLPCKYVIHTVGPVWVDGTQGEQVLLEACYHRVLRLAVSKKCKSVALPLISSGLHGFPKDRVLRIAVSAVEEFLRETELTVYLTVFDKTSYAFSRELFCDVTDYLEAHLDTDSEGDASAYGGGGVYPCDEGAMAYERRIFAMPPAGECRREERAPSMDTLHAWLEKTADQSFALTLFRFIDEKGMSDVECYRRANVDKKTFSKIRCKENYVPNKRTALAFAVALELTYDETQELLASAGLTLSRSSKLDVIVEFFIRNGRYDVGLINETLFEFDQMLLGTVPHGGEGVG